MHCLFSTLLESRRKPEAAPLDEQIGRALDGTADPAEALQETARQWNAITNEVGIDGELRQALGTIQAARHALEQGGEVDLKPLEGKIERFCEALREVPPERRESMKKRVIALIDDLDHLAADLRTQYAELSERIGKMSSHRRALDAYGNSTTDRE